MERELIIKRASEEDSKVVSQILKLAFHEFKEKYTPKAFETTVSSPLKVVRRIKNGVVWLAVLNNVPLGTVTGKISRNIVYIQSMGVLPKERGKKIGYLLLKTIEEYANDNNCDELILSTTPYLNKAISLYNKFGFEIVNKPPYELSETPLFTMHKILK